MCGMSPRRPTITIAMGKCHVFTIQRTWELTIAILFLATCHKIVKLLIRLLIPIHFLISTNTSLLKCLEKHKTIFLGRAIPKSTTQRASKKRPTSKSAALESQVCNYLISTGVCWSTWRMCRTDWFIWRGSWGHTYLDTYKIRWSTSRSPSQREARNSRASQWRTPHQTSHPLSLVKLCVLSRRASMIT